MENNRRIQRVEKEIRELVSSFIVVDMAGLLEGIASVTRVIVSKDLRTAKVLVYSEDPKIMKINVDSLNAEAYRVQAKINIQIRMKYCPKVIFIADDKYDDAMRVERALKLLEDERKSTKT